MKIFSLRLSLLTILLLTLLLPGCDAIVGIFKAGFWTAIVLVLIIVGGGVFAFRKLNS